MSIQDVGMNTAGSASSVITPLAISSHHKSVSARLGVNMRVRFQVPGQVSTQRSGRRRLLRMQGTAHPESVRLSESLALAGIPPELFEYRLWKTVGAGSAVDPY